MTDFTVTRRLSPSGRAEGFEIADRSGAVVWAARGFLTECYLEECIDVALRALRGLPPRHVDHAENLKPATISILKSWVATWHPNTRKAA